MTDWFLIESSDECIKFMYIDKHFINEVQVTRCVTVYKDLTWQVKVHNSTLNHEAFTSTSSHDPPSKLFLKSDLFTLLNAVGMRSELCPGCNIPEFDRIAKPYSNKNSNLKGATETISNRSSQAWQSRRSSNCKYLMYGKSHRTIRCQLECDDSGTLDNDLFYWSMQREVLQSGKTVWHPR